MADERDSGVTRLIRRFTRGLRPPSEAIPAAQLLDRYRTPETGNPVIADPEQPAATGDPTMVAMPKPYPAPVLIILAELARRGSPVDGFLIYECSDLGVTEQGAVVRIAFRHNPQSPIYRLRAVLNKGAIIRLTAE